MIKHIGTVIVMVVAIVLLILNDFGTTTRVYDCGMAEWHPDIPVEVREECRRLRYEEWKRKQEVEKKLIST